MGQIFNVNVIQSILDVEEKMFNSIKKISQYHDFSDVNKNGALWYCNNHKVNIDCGTVFTGKSVLLNLDTWEEHFIYIPKEVE